MTSYLDKIQKRIIKREAPGESAESTLKNDVIRAKDFFVDIIPENIELIHVNKYLDTFHADASANVRNRKISFLEKIYELTSIFFVYDFCHDLKCSLFRNLFCNIN